MTTQVIFKIEKSLKDRAMKKAKERGIAFSAILKLATEAFVADELDIRLEKIENFNTKTQKLIKQAVEDAKTGKNQSPAFDNAKDAIAWLKREVNFEDNLSEKLHKSTKKARQQNSK